MFRLQLIEELPGVGISQRESEQWVEERLKELEGVVTSAFWDLSLQNDIEPVLWEKSRRLMERYKTPTKKSFIAKVRGFIKRSISIT